MYITMNQKGAQEFVSGAVTSIENHDRAYYIWREQKVKNRTLVHIDAHIDVAWFNDHGLTSVLTADTNSALDVLFSSKCEYDPSPDSADCRPDIGNYICQAVREGIVKKIYCVLPDDFLDAAHKISYWKRYLKNVVNAVPGAREKVITSDRRLSARFLNCELILCALESLPVLNDGVLLDIDTDFFVTGFKNHDCPDLVCLEKKLPWIWPDEFIRKLKEKVLHYDIVTIAYSVEGYFTPLAFKWLGDYTRLLLDFSGSFQSERYAMEAAKKACEAVCGNQLPLAAKLWADIVCSVPQQAFAHFNLSLVLYSLGERAKAAEHYARAVYLDCTYRTPYNNLGRIFMRNGLPQYARKEFDKIIMLDSDNFTAHYGLGEILCAEKKINDARREIEMSMKADPSNPGLDYINGAIFLAESNSRKAIDSFESFLAKKSGHLDAYLKLGRLYARRGFVDKAIHCYKCVLRMGIINSYICWALSLLYFRKRRLGKCASFFAKALFLFFPGVVYECGQFHHARGLRKKILEQLR